MLEVIYGLRIYRKILQFEYVIVYLIKNIKCVDERLLGFYLLCSENLCYFLFRNNEKFLYFYSYMYLE